MGILYKLDTADRLDVLLNDKRPSEDVALELLSEVKPDTMMGSL